MKKVLSLILAACMVLAMGITAMAENMPKEYFFEKFRYYVNDDGKATIVKYTGNEENVEVLEKLDTYHASEFGDVLFYNCSNVKSVLIPEGITKMGDNIFYNCPVLEEVNIPATVRQIGANPFVGCENMKTIDLASDNRDFELIDGVLFSKNDNRLVSYPLGKQGSSYTVPDHVEIIGESAFYNCESLTEISFPSGLKKICNDAFTDCMNLTKVIFPEGLEAIGEIAFSWCVSLTDVTIPASVNYIGEDAFSACGDLTITAPAGSYAEQYAKENDIPFRAA